MPLLRCVCGHAEQVSPGRMIVLGEAGLLCARCGTRLRVSAAPPADPVGAVADFGVDEFDATDDVEFASWSDPAAERDDAPSGNGEALEPVVVAADAPLAIDAEPHAGWRRQVWGAAWSSAVHAAVLALLWFVVAPTLAGRERIEVQLNSHWTPHDEFILDRDAAAAETAHRKRRPAHSQAVHTVAAQTVRGNSE